jgi:leader peptidase (prepilin peptidase)/N-methyltransferase
MVSSIILIGLVLFGLVLGSFSGATVWRLRARQLVADKKNGDPFDHVEYKKLKNLAGEKISKDRSRCLQCGYELRWYDLIPLVSWLVLRGKCRNCRVSIGRMEPLVEIGTALFFALSFLLWPVALDGVVQIAQFVLWLVAGVGLAIMFVYDSKWYLLPDKINFAVIGIGLVSAVLVVLESSDQLAAAMSVLGSVAILSGIYFALYFISKGRWIGFGDIKLGLGLGLLLADWQLAFLALFAANFIGSLVVIPLMASGKLKRNAHVPFGPFLIIGAVIAKLVGLGIVDFYTFSLL